MFVSTIYTIKMLAKSRRHVETIGSVTEKRKSRDRKFAISSITFNVVFFLLKMPMTIIISTGYTSANFYLYQIAFSLFFLNFSTSIFVHFFTNSLFRRELSYSKFESLIQTLHINGFNKIHTYEQKFSTSTLSLL